MRRWSASTTRRWQPPAARCKASMVAPSYERVILEFIRSIAELWPNDAAPAPRDTQSTAVFIQYPNKEMPCTYIPGEAEITLTAERDYPNPYTDVDVWADFTHDSGVTLRRPAFWDGERTWRIRFASPIAEGRWTLAQRRHAGGSRPGRADGRVGLAAGPTRKTASTATASGACRPAGATSSMPTGRATVVAGDTAWDPWRATEEQCRIMPQTGRPRALTPPCS